MHLARRVAAITLILAAGGIGANAATAGTAPSFVTRANTVCAAEGAKIDSLPVLNADNGLADLRSNRTIIVQLAARLKAISAPAGKAKAYAAFVGTIKEQGTIIGETLKAASAKQVSKIEQLAKEDDAVGNRGNRQAKALGLSACAKDYEPSASAPSAPAPITTTPTTPTPTPVPPAPPIETVGSSSHATDSEFCSVNTCIGNFTTEGGTIVECSDGTYSHAGGISGACSDHGGELK